jgi:hypothetical protein
MTTKHDEPGIPALYASVRRSTGDSPAGQHIGCATLISPGVAVLSAPDHPADLLDGSGTYWVLAGPADINGDSVFAARVAAASPASVQTGDTPLLLLELTPETPVAEAAFTDPGARTSDEAPGDEPLARLMARTVPPDNWLDAAEQAWTGGGSQSSTPFPVATFPSTSQTDLRWRCWLDPDRPECRNRHGNA